MPQQAWSAKRERQYKHIKDSARDRGASTGRAEEIAARTVNKNRAQQGESRTRARRPLRTSRLSTAVANGPQGPRAGGPTKDQLYNEARKRNIRGRSTMTKKQLENALAADRPKHYRPAHKVVNDAFRRWAS